MTAPGQHYMAPRQHLTAPVWCQRVLEGITRHQMALDGAWTALHGAKTALDGAWCHCWGPLLVRWCWCAGAGALVRRQSGKRLRCYGFQSHFPLLLSTKTPILCSKTLKTGVPKAKSAQKPRFCARNARKRGSRRSKKHKNLDFVLEKPENKGSKPQKRTKTSILCSKSPKTAIQKAKRAQKHRFCAQKDRDWHQEER